MMKNVKYLLPPLLMLIITGCGNTMVEPTPAPEGFEQSATFTIRENQVMRLAAGTSGEGTLVFRGWQHPFLFTDAKIDVVGKQGIEVHGTVFNLETVEDFEGTYQPVKAQIEAGEGLQGIWAKNEKGVTVHLRFPDQDVAIDFEAQGGTITLK